MLHDPFSFGNISSVELLAEFTTICCRVRIKQARNSKIESASEICKSSTPLVHNSQGERSNGHS
jgi:hypothetical protein